MTFSNETPPFALRKLGLNHHENYLHSISDTYSQYRAFAKDKVKAYSTCELVLLDVRTGLVPFARVVSRERLEVKQPADLDLSETMRRAEQASAVEALQAAAEDLVRFMKTPPKKGR